ncbi:hypothetical protein HYP05_gp037 [Salmonella phage ST-W77]|nr:hypothetical protein HYP05_gp037 [Salmonella phage ST-W77]YP_009879534.1 hypothetical protein HYP54_gp121 [Escherichia phage FEC14]QOE31932.1 hypothetical protein ISTP3_orf00125 [Salmonella phage ISTP3]UCR92348.1 hypothetical protein LPEK22_00096 [Escherichia phage LPEK22]WBF04295.1 hypothetical protein [Salmonella phage PST-D24]CAB5494464.1 hypothetical protein [Salmonella phage Se_AO1]ARB12191.1 hypothetical protein STW77_0037 [Salmonella phage ST-W77]
MTKPFLRSGVDSLDSQFKPSEVLIQQIETNREFIEHMLAKPEGEAVHTTKEGNNDD